MCLTENQISNTKNIRKHINYFDHFRIGCNDTETHYRKVAPPSNIAVLVTHSQEGLGE